MKANSEKTKQKKATRRVLAGVLCGASVLSLVLSLVMPPISQAIANDAQTVSTEKTVMGGGSSSESTDVDNTNNGDTENQNSDDVEGGETDPTNGVEQNQAEDQPEGELQVEDNEPADDNAVKVAAEGGQTETASDEIDSAEKLKSGLEAASGTANFKLVNDIDISTYILLDEDGSNITLDLNGHKIKYSNINQPLFNITKGATLTVKDNKQGAMDIPTGDDFVCQDNLLSKNGNLASMTCDNSNIPTNLTYYVTGSSVNADGTSTTETLYKHETSIGGAIVACADKDNLNLDYLKLINLYAIDNKGGTFNLESGVITQQKNISVNSLVYAEEGSTVNMSGGYVCGATSKSQGAGIELGVKNGKGATLKLTGGVIAGSCASNGGGVFANGVGVNPKDSENNMTKINMTGGVISGNSTLNEGLGGGIMAKGGIVTVSGGYITNNRMAKFCGKDGNGDHGGAGLAANYGAKVTISDGQITGNYSDEAGGGVYVTDVERNDQASRSGMAWLNITGGIIASNVSYRSEGAGVRVGQMVDAMINGTENNKVYITNNHCMSRFDWGGGGIFVQGNSNQGKEYTAGRLFIYNSYISANEAGGYGGGVAVCPTGKTLVTNTEGTAIFGNSSAGAEYDNGDRFKNDYKDAYNSEKNTGNEAKPHLSGGGSGKNQDKDAYNSRVFRENGHADFFLAAAGHQEPLAAVIGKMLGDGDAKYSGSKERSDNKDLSDNEELYEAIKIPANGGVKIYRSVGLTSDVTAGSKEANNAQKAARTFITGNYSWDHGGGIMSNGDLYLGVPADTYVYPSLKLKATKELAGRELKAGDFTFTVYRKDSLDPIARGVFTPDTCTEVGTASNDASGIIKFDLGEQFTANGTTGTITYYLVENADNDPDITYDPAVYEITVELAEGTKDVLMSFPIRDNATETKQLVIHNYTIKGMTVTKHSGDLTSNPRSVQADSDGYYYVVAGSNEEKTFTNVYTPYKSTGSWTPKATKVVKGGEMKEFTLQLATDYGFQDIIRETKTTGDKNKQTLSFLDGSDKGIEYSLSDITKDPDVKGDPTGRGASKTFTYYVREQQPTTPFANYKYDKSVYRFDVTMTDQTDGTIKATQVTYTKIEDVDGEPIDDQKPINFDSTKPEELGPTFTNTYSTSLPLSGMSGVTLTYLAGAAVLCAAAAWMHIRRKANAKGGKRRE
ncbi:Spy0128 family protein [Collinsella aerofaciens]|uniref:Spy0128 family protein n=1 Tax=Collinsella aerofaciens TaxID=74426 RepID=UPI0006C697E6|nr:FctA domain-containing protein [Collinsella aerofaciens]CUN45975.1 T surface-antigen of pili [Collinsella aerofaciens]